MQVTKINVSNESNKKAVMNFLAINYPGYKFLREDQYEVALNGRRYNSDNEPLQGKTVRLELEGEGISINVPIEVLRKPNISVIPVHITENDCTNIECIFEEVKKEKIDYAQSEKVLSFQNFEIRNGRVVRRDSQRLMHGENVIIIKA